MLDAKLVDQTGWEHSRGEGTSEDGTELGIQTSDSHVLELEVWCQNGIRGGPRSPLCKCEQLPERRSTLFGTRFEFQPSPLPFHECHIRLLHHHPHVIPPSTSTTQLLSGKLDNPQTFDSSTVVEPPVLEYETFSQTEHKSTVNPGEVLHQIIGGDFGCVVLAEEADFDINGLQVGRGECERLDGDLVTSEGEFHPLTMRAIYADRSRSYLACVIVPVGGSRESQSDTGRPFP